MPTLPSLSVLLASSPGAALRARLDLPGFARANTALMGARSLCARSFRDDVLAAPIHGRFPYVGTFCAG